MYFAFKHLHLLTAVLTLLLTLIWTAIAWRSRSGPGSQLAGRAKVVYIFHRAIAGLAGITGLVLTFIGPWRYMVFPYIGLALFLVHGVAAKISRQTFSAMEQATRRRVALLVQIVVLLLSAYVMARKPW